MGAGLGILAMVTIYFWDAGVCPHFSSCECWHVLGTGKVYIVWIPRDWFRATHFEAVGQIKAMLAPSLPFKNDMVTTSSSRQLPSRKPAIALGPLSVLRQSLVGKGQGADTVAIYFSFWDGGLPQQCQGWQAPLQGHGNQSCTAQQLSLLMEAWFVVRFPYGQHPQTMVRQQMINFYTFCNGD